MPILCSASPHLHPLNKSLSLKEKDHNEQEAYKNSKEEREKRRNEMRWGKAKGEKRDFMVCARSVVQAEGKRE